MSSSSSPVASRMALRSRAIPLPLDIPAQQQSQAHTMTDSEAQIIVLSPEHGFFDSVSSPTLVSASFTTLKGSVSFSSDCLTMGDRSPAELFHQELAALEHASKPTRLRTKTIRRPPPLTFTVDDIQELSCATPLQWEGNHQFLVIPSDHTFHTPAARLVQTSFPELPLLSTLSSASSTMSFSCVSLDKPGKSSAESFHKAITLHLKLPLTLDETKFDDDDAEEFTPAVSASSAWSFDVAIDSDSEYGSSDAEETETESDGLSDTGSDVEEEGEMFILARDKPVNSIKPSGSHVRQISLAVAKSFYPTSLYPPHGTVCPL